MKKTVNLSPNFSKKERLVKDIKFVIIHYTGMQSEIESIKRLKDPKSKVSCHYLINRDGKIIMMVPENKIAWHAGKSKWKNFVNLNKNSIGIELVNKGHEFGYQDFSNHQIRSLINLCRNLKTKYKIRTCNFLGHSDIAPLRKDDPGERFPWKKLSKFKLGHWFKIKKLSMDEVIEDSQKKIFFKNLSKIGYRYFKINNVISKKESKVVKAFQKRYIPKNVTGKIDLKSLKISYFIASKS